jgi:hypothetical protein
VIAYLDVQQLGSAGYLGGILVVDEFGLPVEFRHTLALQPTKLQRTLYGDALDRYLRSAVIAVRLLDDLESRPGVVLASDPVLAVGGDELPVAALERSGLDPIGAPGTLQPLTGASPGFVLQLRAGEAPLRLISKADPSCYRSMADAVLEAAETMDVLEPPARVRAALQLIGAGERGAAAA